MATRKSSKNKKQSPRSRSKKSSAKKRVAGVGQTSVTEALMAAAEALTRANEAMLTAIRTQVGDAGVASGFSEVAALADAGMKGNCLDLSSAGQIVQNAVNSSSFDIDKTLAQMGIGTVERRRVFRERVANSVRNLGCQINDSDVPNAAGDTARRVRDTILEQASQ